MFKNYLKIAFRIIRKDKGFSFINIAGLALGMACCILTMLWIQDELSFDRFHKNSDRLCLIINHHERGWSSNSAWAFTPILKKDFPEIKKATRFNKQNLLVKYNDQKFYESVAYVDPDFLEMFTFPLVQGNPLSA